jgi:GT2 family glycosyltransferase
LCVKSLLNSDFQEFGVIVVDNFSKDDSPLKLGTFFSEDLHGIWLKSRDLNSSIFEQTRFLFVEHHQNAGFAAGNNLVLKYLQNLDVWIWLLNPDIQVDKSTLSCLLKDAGEGKNQIIGTNVFSQKSPDQLLHIGAWKINWFSGTVSPVLKMGDSFDYLYGGSLFTHADNFLKFNLLPENYFLYWEETDWCYQLSQAGIAQKISGSARVYDRVGGSVGRGYLAFYYYTLSSLKFMKKFKPQMIKWVLFFNFFRFLKKLISFNLSQAKGIWKGSLEFLK